MYLLVSDHVLSGKLDNLNVNADDPIGKYVPTNGVLSTTDADQWIAWLTTMK